jgi:hypothetical protein
VNVVSVVVVLAVFLGGGAAFLRIRHTLGRDVQVWRKRHGDPNAHRSTVMSMEDWRRFRADAPPTPKLERRRWARQIISWFHK